MLSLRGESQKKHLAAGLLAFGIASSVAASCTPGGGGGSTTTTTTTSSSTTTTTTSAPNPGEFPAVDTPPGYLCKDVTNSTANANSTIWAVGDSIVAASISWSRKLDVPVRNIAIGGTGLVRAKSITANGVTTSETFYTRIRRCVAVSGAPTKVFISGGVNDMYTQVDGAYISFDRMLAEMRLINDYLTSIGTEVVWVVPAYTAQQRATLSNWFPATWTPNPRAFLPTMRQYAFDTFETVFDCGPQLGATPVAVPNTNPAIYDMRANSANFDPDGIHPNATGHNTMAACVNTNLAAQPA
jgi:lysophospholipase L1-like esterase